jgi:hypothetical protein
MVTRAPWSADRDGRRADFVESAPRRRGRCPAPDIEPMVRAVDARRCRK